MDTSKIINSVTKDYTYTLTKIITLVLGKTTQLMGKVSLNISKEFSIQVNGSMTSRMVMVNSIGLMELYLKVFLKKVIREKVNFLGQIKALMKGSLLMISLKVKVHFFGKIIEAIKELGKQIKCMVLELLLGPTVKALLDSMKQTKRMVKVSSL